MSLCRHPIISVFLFPVSTAKKAGVAVRICEALQMICSPSLALYVTLHLLALQRLQHFTQ
jgi:hypothetical protein